MKGFDYTVALRHVPTGEVRIVKDRFDFSGYTRDEDWEHDADYIWLNGNYSCDCNRHNFFNRIGNPEFDEEIPCGDVLYAVDWIRNEESGRLTYETFVVA